MTLISHTLADRPQGRVRIASGGLIARAGLGEGRRAGRREAARSAIASAPRAVLRTRS